ncbi:MAG: disulfide bond formation protein B [Pseudomonadota bacterium]|nr:disulfide bond formation protein B [Pseudomonadota bacterium]MDE3038892.1 disulfide bond formation protein B [Pseudomonadota bacterium]
MPSAFYDGGMCVAAILTNFPLRALLLALAAVSAAILGVAFVAQYGFGLHPCELCLAQRYPYAAIVILGLAGFFISSPRARLVIAWLCALLFLADAGIAFYHAGVELGLFPGPSACATPPSQGETLEDMRRALMIAPLVPCNQPMVSAFGLSMAAWNAITATLLAAGTAALLWRRR